MIFYLPQHGDIFYDGQATNRTSIREMHSIRVCLVIYMDLEASGAGAGAGADYHLCCDYEDYYDHSRGYDL